jgi:type IV pilus assembly protein PilC
MAFLSTTSSASGVTNATKAPRKSARVAQALAKRKSWEKKAGSHKVKMGALAVFTQQLASMLDAGLSLVVALEALQEQVEDPIFQVILSNVKADISTGTSFSEATRKYPNAFPNLFVSMVEAGEASGGLAEILAKVADYFEASVKLTKKVKSAMTYPIAVIGLAIILVNVLLIFVIPVFAEMFADFGAELPKPTQFLISLSDWMKSNVFYCIIAGYIGYKIWSKFVKTPRGRALRDRITIKAPIFGNLIKKISLARFCRTYATLLRSGVPILRALEIVAASSGRVQIEEACTQISKHISSGGQVSDVLRENIYFPAMVAHMLKAGESTGNVDGMMEKIADFYDTESEAIIASLTSLIEPILIVFLGVVVGGIVMAMFLPIFHLSSVVG